MQRAEALSHEQEWGTIHIEPEREDSLPQEMLNKLRNGGITSRFAISRYTWVPPETLADQLPPGFTFSLRCICFPEDELRRFYPLNNFDEYIAQAFAGGLALLDRIKNLSPEQRFSYRAMWQFFQRIRRTREHFGNRLLNGGSLRITRSGREGSQNFSILPESVGLNSQKKGKPWAVGQLLRIGESEARAQGISNPTEEDCVGYGLVCAARLDPLEVPEDQVPALIRLALYESIPVEAFRNLSPDDPLVTKLREAVLDRSLVALERHLGDEAALFDGWLAGQKNSFVRQLAQQKKAFGGPLQRDVVRRVLQDLGWDAYPYMADCLHVMMWVFMQILPEPLNEAEKSRFERMYFKQSYFGRLPSALLAERFRFLNGILWDIVEATDNRSAIAVLHRLLAYYGEMATNRRMIDRTIKDRNAARDVFGFAGECELNPAIDQADRQVTEYSNDPDAMWLNDLADDIAKRIARLADLVRQENKIHCTCAVPRWDCRATGQTGQIATLMHRCRQCGSTTSTEISIEELQRICAE
jgi:hypothetical protein